MEFALVLPVLLVMLLGVIDFGRAFYGGIMAEQAAREGARLGMGAQAGTGNDVAQVQTQVQNALAYGCAGCPNFLGLTSAPTVNVGGYTNTGTAGSSAPTPRPVAPRPIPGLTEARAPAESWS